MSPPARIPLPVDSVLGAVTSALFGPGAPGCAVLQASPGTGKTTRVPPAVLAACAGEVLVLEPRRLAAKWAARRVADELGEAVGRTVGYQFRFESVGTRETRLRFLTEGILMRRLLGDPELRGVSAVILDEFHERHLQGDLALAWLRWLREGPRPDLRVLVMSATLDSEALATYLGGCPIVRIEASLHPVAVEYLPAPPARPLDRLVVDAVGRALDGAGDVLVFLPGMAEIRRAASALEPLARARDLEVALLHGDLSREEQDRALARATRTKVILSTNLAETSLTIEGVTTVIDSGLHRIAGHARWSGLSALRTRPISRASATQRAGRAGRTRPGRCLRLYSRGEFDARAAFDVPEIQRADAAQTVLELKTLAVGDLARFPWFEPPPPASLAAACRTLFLLGALDGDGPDARITPLGRAMARIPAHPRIGRLLLAAGTELERAAALAVELGEGELGLDALESLGRASAAGADGPSRARRQLVEAARRELARPDAPAAPAAAPAGASSRATADERLAAAVLRGFPDRVARRRDATGDATAAPPARPAETRAITVDTELLLAGGGSARVATAALPAGDTFVILDAAEKEARASGTDRARLEVRALVPIREEWLFDLEPSLLAEVAEPVWDRERGKVWLSESLRYGELTLSERRREPTAELAADRGTRDAAARLLLREAMGIDPALAGRLAPREWLDKLAPFTDRAELESLLARLTLLARHGGDPAYDFEAPAADLWARLSAGLASRLSRKALAEADWPALLLESLAEFPALPSELARRAPSHVTFANGRRARIQYRLGLPPWVESRMQDFFGLAQGPAILDGRLPLTLHLLAPNLRAIQVTTDLAGFWQRAYLEQKPALSRRYPRHYWPADPRQAEPPAPRPPRKT